MSLATRAVVAILLMIGFYVLALGIVGVLFWIPYAEWSYANRFDLRIAAFCIISAFVILGSILPRRDHFKRCTAKRPGSGCSLLKWSRNWPNGN